MALKRKRAASPQDLLDSLRDAQARHAAEVSKANQRLIESHSGVLGTVQDRRSVIYEQIKVLSAEDEGLAKVESEAQSVPQV